MKHALSYAIFFVFGMVLLTGCKGDNESNLINDAEKEVIETMDSLSTDLDKTIETLNTKTKELDNDIDDLLKDFDE